jgi:hypothetical protein
MQNLEDIFELIKFEKFIVNYTTIPIKGGIKARKAGKGTNESDKNKTYKPGEIEDMKNGLIKLLTDINQVVKKIENGN